MANFFEDNADLRWHFAHGVDRDPRVPGTTPMRRSMRSSEAADWDLKSVLT